MTQAKNKKTSENTISLIVPCYNEESNVEPFHKEICRVFKQIKGADFELMFVDDGSKDSTFENIQELRKNLTETSSNAQQNQQLQDELNKIKLMNKENSFNNSLLLSNSFNNIFHINNSNTNINNENDTLLTDYDTFLNNNSHNEQNIEDDNPLNISLDTGKEKEKENYIKFNKLPNPKNKAEIKIFVNNLLCYINIMLSCSSMKSNTKFNDELFIFKYKLETRYNDYRNHGLNEQYFINILNQNQ